MKVAQLELDAAGITPDSSAHSYAWLGITHRFAGCNELFPDGLVGPYRKPATADRAASRDARAWASPGSASRPGGTWCIRASTRQMRIPSPVS